MFTVTFGLTVIAQNESLPEACRFFIQHVKNELENGGISEFVLYESSYITKTYDGFEHLMNFDAIRNFSHSIGLLKPDGTLREANLPYIPQEIIKEVFIANSNNSWEAYLNEHFEILRNIAMSVADNAT